MHKTSPVSIAAAVLCGVVLSSTCIRATAAEHPPYHEVNHAKASPDLPSYKKVSVSMTGQIRSVGADTMDDLMKLWTADFNKLYPDIHFTMEAKASGTAAPALTEGIADIGPVAREVLPNEEKPFEDRYSYPLTAIRVAGGSYRTPGKTHAIAILVNAKNPIAKLSFDQLDAVYSTTRKRGYKAVNTWGDLGLTGEWADKPVHLWGLIQPNGIAYFLQGRVMEFGDFKDGITERTTVGKLAALDAVAQGVAKDPYAITYSGLTSVIEGTKALPLSVSAAGPYYQETFQEVVDQKYPLSRVVYIYINRKPGTPIDPKVKEFLKFILSKDGQTEVEKEGVFLPLPPLFVAEDLKKLD